MEATNRIYELREEGRRERMREPLWDWTPFGLSGGEGLDRFTGLHRLLLPVWRDRED